MPSKDKAKIAAYQKAWYESHKTQHRAKVDAQRADKAAMIRKHKQESPCTDCGLHFHFAAMDFDHRPGEVKSFNLSQVGWSGYGYETIAAEMAKCDLVCSNCHRVRTWSRANAPIAQQ